MADSGNIGAVIVAAGESRRLGTPKQLILFDGEPLVRRAARIALSAGLFPVVVVVGHEAERVRAVLADLPLAVVENADWATGVGRSIVRGVAEVTRLTNYRGAVMLLVCDQPLVTRDHLEALAGAVRGGAPLAASTYAGTQGVPAVFGPPLFPELLALVGDSGAKAIIRRHRSGATLVPFAGAEHDVDTSADLARLRGETRGPT